MMSLYSTVFPETDNAIKDLDKTSEEEEDMFGPAVFPFISPPPLSSSALIIFLFNPHFFYDF